MIIAILLKVKYYPLPYDQRFEASFQVFIGYLSIFFLEMSFYSLCMFLNLCGLSFSIFELGLLLL